MHDSTSDANVTVPVLAANRRRLLGGLVGGTLAGVFGWQETEADRKRRRDPGDPRREEAKRKIEGESNREDRASTLGDGESKQGGNAPSLKVLTRNLYLGADLAPIFRVRSLEELVAAVGQVFAMVQSTNFPERAKALADEIAEIDAHIVGLQEVTRWRSGPADSVPLNAETNEYNFLTILLDALAARGKSYTAIATVQNVDAEAPGLTATGLQDIRTTDRDVILARTDLPAKVFSVANAQLGNFAAQLTIPNPVLGGLPSPRGWTAVDVRLHGETIRVVNTHLEPSAPNIQVAQGQELLAGPLNSGMPTVLLGDLNSDGNGGGTQGQSNTATYGNLLAAGFEDAWTTTRGNETGLTWGHAEDLRNPTPALTQRIDFVLTRGGMKASSANRVGHELEDRTQSGLWPSDHVGVWAVLHLEDA